MSVGGRRIDRFLRLMADRGASDLHLSVGRPPMFRSGGEISPIRYRVLSNKDFVEFIKPIAGAKRWRQFQAQGDCDFAYAVPNVARFRVNLMMQERGFSAVFRIIPTRLMNFSQLGLPRAVEKLCRIDRGLILVTGPTGSGKSTTLSAVIDRINEEQELHIITIEDPIEFVHPSKRSIVSQREIHKHATDFGGAVKAAVREDPDVILVGEMRDLETIRTALGAAEAGFLVFGTLHTNNAAKAVDRIVNVFPQEEHDGVRNALGEALKAVVAQQLVKKIGGGRVAALEILFSTPGLSNMIREGRTTQITSMIQMGRSSGMRSMDDSLTQLFSDELISVEAAYEKAVDKPAMKEKLKQLDPRAAADLVDDDGADL
ncbi:MAG: type IV pilus twitching motility protein PilT [Proteobacteria bacterium]|nr:type IV pilus twitching motility protein PilT [Pseudomonadota bacterium]